MKFFNRFNLRKSLIAIAIVVIPAIIYVSHAQLTRPDPTQAQPTLPVSMFMVNGVSVAAEVADEPFERRQGLSYRKTLGKNAGMLFVYTAERELAFTMRYASIPLSIAFLDKSLRILEILDMEPFTDGPYPSKHKAQYALEMNQGWFAHNNVKPGDQLQPGKLDSKE